MSKALDAANVEIATLTKANAKLLRQIAKLSGDDEEAPVAKTKKVAAAPAAKTGKAKVAAPAAKAKKAPAGDFSDEEKKERLAAYHKARRLWRAAGSKGVFVNPNDGASSKGKKAAPAAKTAKKVAPAAKTGKAKVAAPAAKGKKVVAPVAKGKAKKTQDDDFLL